MTKSRTHLLIVDDNAGNVLFISALLKGIDVHLIKAFSGEEALQLTSGLDLALAILDVQMPGMDGYELAVKLNAERNEHIPIIFITASYPDNKQILRGYAAGAVDFINKPFQSQILISKVHIFLELHRQKQQIREIANELSLTTASLYKANESLIVSEEEYRTLLNASPDGIVLINLYGAVTEISQSALTLFGMENREDMLGRHFLRFLHFGQSGKVRKVVERLRKEGLAQNLEFTLLRKGYGFFPSEISAAMIERHHGAPLSVMILVRDISERKIMESKLLHSERLVSLGEMASAMAHEINQPLNTLSLIFENMMLEASNKEVLSKNYFERKSTKIFESIRRIRDTIDHIRVFSRSNIQAQTAPFDINKSIDNALSLMSEQIKQKGISLTFTPSNDLPQVEGNTFELEQAMINILSNARDAILEKQLHVATFPPAIQIRTRKDRGNLVIEVQDNGTGIRQEHLDQIMLPFFSTKEAGKGTGLGLSITYGIVRNMNGDIQVSSLWGEGTTLSIILPTPNQQFI